MGAGSVGPRGGSASAFFSNGSSDSTFIHGNVVPPCGTPSVSLTSPANGTTVSPNAQGKIVIQATASDSSGIDRVELFVDGQWKDTDRTAPYVLDTEARTGAHTVTVRATNSCGNRRTSAPITVTVNCGPIQVAMTGPVNGSTVFPNIPGNVILNATASHSTGIQKVNFFVDTVFKQTDILAPYAWAWPAQLGNHFAAARAFSRCGNAQTSPRTHFTVIPR